MRTVTANGLLCPLVKAWPESFSMGGQQLREALGFSGNKVVKIGLCCPLLPEWRNRVALARATVVRGLLAELADTRSNNAAPT